MDEQRRSRNSFGLITIYVSENMGEMKRFSRKGMGKMLEVSFMTKFWAEAKLTFLEK
jgi:hypothetical protein